MTTNKTTAADQLPPDTCSNGVTYARKFSTLGEAWDKCERSDWMIWLVRRRKKITKPQAIEIAIECAARVLAIYEKRNPKDKRPRAAIDAARKWLADPSEENRNAAADAAYAAADAAHAAANAAYAVYAAYAAADAAHAAANAADERTWQRNRLIELMAI